MNRQIEQWDDMLFCCIFSLKKQISTVEWFMDWLKFTAYYDYSMMFNRSFLKVYNAWVATERNSNARLACTCNFPVIYDAGVDQIL